MYKDKKMVSKINEIRMKLGKIFISEIQGELYNYTIKFLEVEESQSIR